MKSYIRAVVKKLHNTTYLHPLFFIVIVFFLFRIPSLIEPYWYGDEGIYQVIGAALRDGRLLYRDIWDNKPPLLYLIYALFNGDLFLVRSASLIVGGASVITFFFLAQKLLEKKYAIYFATLVYAVAFALPLFEGNIANAENFMLFPVMLSAYFIFTFFSHKDKKHLLFAGLLLSLAFLVKIVALFDFIPFFLYLLFYKRLDRIVFLHVKHPATFLSAKMKLHDVVRILSSFALNMKRVLAAFSEELVFGLSFVLPIFIVSTYFFVQGIFPDYWRAVFSQNVGYVGYENYFLIPMGLLIIKTVMLIAFVMFLYGYKRRLHHSFVFLLLWLSFSLFNTLFSDRPYTHYLLVMLPSFCLFLGNWVTNRTLLLMKTLIIFVVFAIVGKNFNLYSKVFSYYQNYMGFIFGSRSVDEYRSFFDRNTLRDYEVAQFLLTNTTKQDTVFLWTDSGQIYVLSEKLPPGRYVVSYHITSYKDALSETQKAVYEKRPKFIVVTKDSPYVSFFLKEYELRYKVKEAKIYERKI